MPKVDPTLRPPYMLASRARSSGVEHLTFNQRVVGSKPTGLASHLPGESLRPKCRPQPLPPGLCAWAAAGFEFFFVVARVTRERSSSLRTARLPAMAAPFLHRRPDSVGSKLRIELKMLHPCSRAAERGIAAPFSGSRGIIWRESAARRRTALYANVRLLRIGTRHCIV